MNPDRFNIMDHSTGAPTSEEPFSEQDAAIEATQPLLDSVDTRQTDNLFPGRKRKHHLSEDDQVDDQCPELPLSVHHDDAHGEQQSAQRSSEHTKRPRLGHSTIPLDRSQLPMEIWHHIFSFLDPKTLGILLRVDRAFHSFLTSKDHDPLGSSSVDGILRPVSSSSIWSSSRKLFHPGMPRPLANMTELDMWKLIGTTSCEACGKNNLTNPTPTAPSTLEKGPGFDGVRIFWPFAIRTCLQCFLKYTKKVRLVNSTGRRNCLHLIQGCGGCFITFAHFPPTGSFICAHFPFYAYDIKRGFAI